MSQRHVPNTVVIKQLASWKNLIVMKFELAQISRKLAQATASQSQVRGQTRYKRAQAKNLR